MIGLDAIVGLAFRGLGLCRRDEPGVDEFIPKSGIFIENENAGSEEFILTSLSLLLYLPGLRCSLVEVVL